VNNVIKYYNDNEIKDQELINMPIKFIIEQFFVTWMAILNDLYNFKELSLNIFMKDNRLFYIGMMLVIISIFLLLVSYV
jgi:hypothetical protein